MKKTRRNYGGFTILTIFLISIILFCATGTVLGQEKNQFNPGEKYYQKLEKEYKEQVRGYLTTLGYENSGITLTKVLLNEGTRDYTLTIHHRKINKLSTEEQNYLIANIKKLDFQMEGVTFFHEFLATE